MFLTVKKLKTFMVSKVELVFFYHYYCRFIFLRGNTSQTPNMFLTRFWRFTENGSFQKHSSHETSWVRTLWAQYEVMYVGAGGHAGPQTALLNHSSRGHHLYMHHLGTHEITDTLNDLQQYIYTAGLMRMKHLKCVSVNGCELCPRPVCVVCVLRNRETYQVLNVAIDVFLHAWRPCGHPATQRTELHGVRFVARTVTMLIQL